MNSDSIVFMTDDDEEDEETQAKRRLLLKGQMLYMEDWDAALFLGTPM